MRQHEGWLVWCLHNVNVGMSCELKTGSTLKYQLSLCGIVLHAFRLYRIIGDMSRLTSCNCEQI